MGRLPQAVRLTPPGQVKPPIRSGSIPRRVRKTPPRGQEHRRNRLFLHRFCPLELESLESRNPAAGRSGRFSKSKMRKAGKKPAAVAAAGVLVGEAEAPPGEPGGAGRSALLGGVGFRPIEGLQLVARRGDHHLREVALDAILVGVLVVADFALDEHLGTLGEGLGGEPVDRGLVPDLDRMPGRVILLLVALLGVAAGGDPQDGDLLAALGGANFDFGARETDQLDLVQHRLSPSSARRSPGGSRSLPRSRDLEGRGQGRG